MNELHLLEMKKMPKTPRVVDYVVAMYSKDLFGAANQVVFHVSFDKIITLVYLCTM